MSFLIIKLHEEKYRVSPHVASNFFEPTSPTTRRIQLVGSCVTGIIRQKIRQCDCAIMSGPYIGHQQLLPVNPLTAWILHL